MTNDEDPIHERPHKFPCKGVAALAAPSTKDCPASAELDPDNLPLDPATWKTHGASKKRDMWVHLFIKTRLAKEWGKNMDNIYKKKAEARRLYTESNEESREEHITRWYAAGVTLKGEMGKATESRQAFSAILTVWAPEILDNDWQNTAQAWLKYQPDQRMYEVLKERILKHRAVVILLEEFRKFLVIFVETHSIDEWSADLELSSKTKSGKPRLHFHMANSVLKRTQQRVTISYAHENLYRFFNIPLHFQLTNRRFGKAAAHAAHGCHLYCQGPKKYKLWEATNFPLGEGWHVPGKRILEMYLNGKGFPSEARNAIIANLKT